MEKSKYLQAASIEFITFTCIFYILSQLSHSGIQDSKSQVGNSDILAATLQQRQFWHFSCKRLRLFSIFFLSLVMLEDGHAQILSWHYLVMNTLWAQNVTRQISSSREGAYMFYSFLFFTSSKVQFIQFGGWIARRRENSSSWKRNNCCRHLQFEKCGSWAQVIQKSPLLLVRHNQGSNAGGSFLQNQSPTLEWSCIWWIPESQVLVFNGS